MDCFICLQDCKSPHANSRVGEITAHEPHIIRNENVTGEGGVIYPSPAQQGKDSFHPKIFFSF